MAASRTEHAPRALVVSPFATTPRDAGHRRRVWQMTRLLADAGYGITFLLFAFEDDWAWAHDAEALAAMRAEWDEALVVYAGAHVGRPPRDGATHGLDEWWDPALETALVNLGTRRFFDVVVVHNVWLSKAFDFVHRASTKVLETHDLFWKRPAAFAAIGEPPSFFTIDRDSELFGLARADIVVTIQEHEARELLDLTPRRVVNVPFYDVTLEDAVVPAALRHPDKVSFGFLGSASPFNQHGLNALLTCLEAHVAQNFAPVDIVVGGGVCELVSTRLPVRRLGRVASERGFYADIDYAIAPVFAGTGFKIKTADVLALARPLLVAAHAAEGLAIDRALVSDTPEEMAARIAALSLRRDDPRALQAMVLRARDALRARTATAGASLLRAIARVGTTLVVDLHDADLGHSALKLQGWLGMSRTLSARARVLLILPDTVRGLVGPVLPPGVRGLSLAAFDGLARFWPAQFRIDATHSGARHDSDIRDTRWSGGDLAGPLADLPLLHPDVTWEPAARRLRQVWESSFLPRQGAPLLGLVILRGGTGNRRGALGAGRAFTLVDDENDAAVQAILMRLLCGAGPAEIVVTGTAPASIRRMTLEVCVIAGVPFHGLVDAAAVPPPTPLGARTSDDRVREIRRRVGDGLAALLRAREAPCPRA